MRGGSGMWYYGSMKLMKTIFKVCGKDMPLDKEKSNENWRVYKMKCECGGQRELKFYEEKRSN